MHQIGSKLVIKINSLIDQVCKIISDDSSISQLMNRIWIRVFNDNWISSILHYISILDISLEKCCKEMEITAKKYKASCSFQNENSLLEKSHFIAPFYYTPRCNIRKKIV